MFNLPWSTVPFSTLPMLLWSCLNCKALLRGISDLKLKKVNKFALSASWKNSQYIVKTLFELHFCHLSVEISYFKKNRVKGLEGGKEAISLQKRKSQLTWDVHLNGEWHFLLKRDRKSLVPASKICFKVSMIVKPICKDKELKYDLVFYRVFYRHSHPFPQKHLGMVEWGTD